jgi:hypothetical protein
MRNSYTVSMPASWPVPRAAPDNGKNSAAERLCNNVLLVMTADFIRDNPPGHKN